jgi:hypothetical protein
MGFAPAWKFEKVLDLAFAGGRLEEVVDHSALMTELRHQIQRGERPDPDQDPDLGRWIATTFERDIGRSFPDAPR